MLCCTVCDRQMFLLLCEVYINHLPAHQLYKAITCRLYPFNRYRYDYDMHCTLVYVVYLSIM